MSGMHAASRSLHRQRRLPRLLLCAAWALLLVVLPDSAVAAQPLLVVEHPSRASFVPDWNGESDSTAIIVTLRRTRQVMVEVYPQGSDAPVRLLHRGTLRGGRSTLWWDGRDDAGRVVAPGRYVVEARVIARRDGLQAMVDRPEAVAHTSVQVRPARLTVSAARTSRGTIGARSGFRTTSFSFRTSGRAWITAVVARPDGSVVKTLAMGRLRPGLSSVTWDGLSGTGRRAGDGPYEVLIAGTRGAMPSNTVSMPVRVDTTPPQVTTAARIVRGRLRDGRVMVTLPLAWSEGGSLRIGTSRHGIDARPTQEGRHNFRIDGRLLGIRARGRARAWVVPLKMVDDAGNVVSSSVTVAVPASARPARPAPPVRPPDLGRDSGTYAWPSIGCLTSHFGSRGSSFHYGLDIATPVGTTVSAARTGLVSYAGTMGGYGQVVVIEHRGGASTRYAHLSRIDVVVGQEVAAGQAMALSGNSGRSTGPHVHFEIRNEGVAADPLSLLPASGRPPEC